ncbi:MAG: TlpA family protein disulfide reductase [Saprospiraceae bacterium]
MNKLKSLFLLFLPVFAVMIACDSQANGHSIKGTISGASNLQVSLDLAHFDRSTVSLGRATCDANGAFAIKLEKPWDQGLYRLKIGAKQLYFILDGKETIVEITGDLSTIDRMEVQVKGSETLNCYAGIIKELIANQLKSPEEAKVYIQRGCTPLMQAFLTTQLLGQNAAPFVAEFKAQEKALKAAMPGTKYASDFTAMIARLESPQAQQGGSGEAITVGMPAPDISLPDPNGKVRSLSSLKGKVVLLDFWASWCGPCRKANPHVVEVYNKYKSKGFDVFSVSLDREDGKQKWIDAIKQDGLVWGNHVSDLKFWDSAPAGVYGVRSIPKTFLIGKDGKIVAVNPRDNLEAELLKVL